MSKTINGSILSPERALSEAFQIARSCEIRMIDAGKGIIETIVSNREVDRYRSIILPVCFDRLLSRYLANPAFLWRHNRDKVLGTCLKIWRTETEVWARFQFDLKSEFAAEIFRKYKEKIVRGFSVSGIPHEVYYYWDSKKRMAQLEDLDEEAARALRAGECDFVITDMELTEISGCVIPGNASIVARYLDNAVSDGVLTRSAADNLLNETSRHLSAPTERKEAEDDMDEEKMDKLAKLVTERVLEGLPKPVEAELEVVEERGLTETQRNEIKQIVVDTLAEVFTA